MNHSKHQNNAWEKHVHFGPFFMMHNEWLSYSGPILVLFWSYSGPILVVFWSFANWKCEDCPILVLFWSYSGPVLVLFWSYCNLDCPLEMWCIWVTVQFSTIESFTFLWSNPKASQQQLHFLVIQSKASQKSTDLIFL